MAYRSYTSVCSLFVLYVATRNIHLFSNPFCFFSYDQCNRNGHWMRKNASALPRALSGREEPYNSWILWNFSFYPQVFFSLQTVKKKFQQTVGFCQNHYNTPFHSMLSIILVSWLMFLCGQFSNHCFEVFKALHKNVSSTYQLKDGPCPFIRMPFSGEELKPSWNGKRRKRVYMKGNLIWLSTSTWFLIFLSSLYVKNRIHNSYLWLLHGFLHCFYFHHVRDFFIVC